MIDSFKGEFAFLSNFYDAPVRFNGRLFQNSEGAYQAEKFSHLWHTSLPGQFLQVPGGVAKKLARINKSAIREDWKDVSLATMSEVVHAKFTQNKDIRRLLINTFPHDLVEGNYWHDVFYGRCSCAKCGGQGENWLGSILQAERAYWIQAVTNKSWERNNDGLQHNSSGTE